MEADRTSAREGGSLTPRVECSAPVSGLTVLTKALLAGARLRLRRAAERDDPVPRVLRVRGTQNTFVRPSLGEVITWHA